jgi:hypothetical protein
MDDISKHTSVDREGRDNSRDAGRARSIVAAVLLTVVLAGMATYGWRWQADRSYVGSTTRVDLTWTCFNGIFWTDPDRNVRWWAGQEPVTTGIETRDRDQAGAGSPISTKHARGILRFESRDTATFVSDTGVSMAFTRQEPGRFYQANCALGPGG